MTVMVSGGFSILHKGHVRLIAAARAYGPVVVALNSDAWLRRKHPDRQLPNWTDRAEVLCALKHVSQVIPVDDSDDTVCEALLSLHPLYFANGGDRTVGNTKESTICKRLSIVELFKVGGGKVESSRNLCSIR